MNASEELDEPLGESPDVGGIPGLLIDANRIMDESMGLHERQGEALREIREMHGPIDIVGYDYLDDEREVCETCRDVDGESIDYPCPTVALIDLLEVR